MFARTHGYRLDSNQELLALSGANLAAGLGHGFPVSGGMSQSLVNEGGGARTPRSGLVASGIMLVVTLFLFRAESALLYLNVEHVRDRFFELLSARGEGVKLAVFFLGTSPGVDLAGAELLEELHHALQPRRIAFRLAEARGDVRETLRRSGFEQHCFPVVANQPVATVVSEWRGNA